MDAAQKILSDITVFNKYAKHSELKQRRETWNEICDRNADMHIQKYPALAGEILSIYETYVKPKLVLPSMRSMQFGGKPIQLANNRIFNCAYAAVNHPAIFSEAMFLLLGGTGLGYSVQAHHVVQLPLVQGPKPKTRRFLVADSIEGWADAVKVLVEAFFFNKSDPIFDFRDIRVRGSLLKTTGGRAPGPDPLRICLDQIRTILNRAVGRNLNSLEAHDLMCHIADAVLSGGIRRAALISLFSHDDMNMLSCKSGAWWELNPQRGRANNSVVLLRSETSQERFTQLWERIKLSGCGEPGIFWTNSLELGTNPCAEISLENMQFCNLTEINAGAAADQITLNDMARAAAFIGTLQAGYMNFHYLRPEWRENSEREALIGVGQTGICAGAVLKLDLTEAANCVKEENERVAKLIGINPAARTTTVKPSGTSSLTIGTSSGIHAWHDQYYIRRMRVGKTEPLYRFMVETAPSLIEDCKFKPHIEAVMSFPQMAPAGAIMRSESALDTLERVKRFNLEWIRPGHRSGDNFHNVSCTISIKADEWDSVQIWMWNNRESYTGISILPFDGGSYVQAPFESCSKEMYEQLLVSLREIDLSKMKEVEDTTNLSGEVACAGGACEL